jgi:hypothetical protein
MKKRIRMFLPIVVILAMLISLFGMALPVAADTLAHGISVVKTQYGPWPDPDIALAGDTVTVEIMVTNMDTTPHAVRIDSITDVVQHASGNVSSGNLLSSPVTLPTYLNSVTVNYTYVVENGDKNPLIDTASAVGVDLGTNLAVGGSAMYQLTIITPDIDIEKYVSVDGGTSWEDADTAPFPTAVVGNNVWFYVTVCNNGSTNLTDILVSDTDFTFAGIATSLGVGVCDNSTIVTVPAVAGLQYDLADVTGTPPVGPNVTDNDPASYTGLTPDIDIEKFVSVDGGLNWEDADSAPGPTAIVGNDVWFKVVVCNNGTGDLTSVVVTDTDFTFTGVAASLAVGECDESDVLVTTAVGGQNYDLADVTGTPPVGPDVTDEDPAYYSTSPEVGGNPVPVNKWVGVVLAGFLGVLLFLKLRKRREA